MSPPCPLIVSSFPLEGETSETVAQGLVYPDALKFDSDGSLVVTEAATGNVVRIDPRTGDKSPVAQLEPGLDNCTFVGNRLFASNFTGQITEILAGGQTRTALAGGLNWPLDLTLDAQGNLYIADGTNTFQLLPDGSLRTVGMMFSPGYPGVVRGLSWVKDNEFLACNTNGQVSRYWPAKMEQEIVADGLDPQLYGVAPAPGGAVVVAELGTGRVLSIGSGAAAQELASGLREPMGVAFGPDGSCLVSESAGNRVVALDGQGRAHTVIDDLNRPQGIAVHAGRLYVVDAGAKTLIECDLNGPWPRWMPGLATARRARKVVARNLPVGPPPGTVPKPLLGIQPFSGPQGPFAGIAAAPDGTLFISADGDGSVLSLHGTGA